MTTSLTMTEVWRYGLYPTNLDGRSLDVREDDPKHQKRPMGCNPFILLRHGAARVRSCNAGNGLYYSRGLVQSRLRSFTWFLLTSEIPMTYLTRKDLQRFHTLYSSLTHMIVHHLRSGSVCDFHSATLTCIRERSFAEIDLKYGNYNLEMK